MTEGKETLDPGAFNRARSLISGRALAHFPLPGLGLNLGAPLSMVADLDNSRRTLYGELHNITSRPWFYHSEYRDSTQHH